MTITESITINAPIENVFQTFTDLKTATQILSEIKSYKLLKGTEVMEVGTTWEETRSMMGKDSTERMWVTELTKNASYAVDAQSHGTKYQSRFTFTETENGTEVSWEFEGTPVTTGAKLMSLTAIIFKGSLKKMLRKDMEELKAYCELKTAA